MTVNTLFGQPAAPATLAPDPTGYTMSVEFSVSVPTAFLTAIWFYSAPGAAALPQDILLFTVAGTSVVFQQGATWSAAAGAGWVRAPVTSPPALAMSAMYKGCVSQDTLVDWYSATPHDWDSGAHSAGASDGPLSAPDDAGASPGQGSFSTSANSYPNQSFNATNYWVDVEITIFPVAPLPSRGNRPGIILPYRKPRSSGSRGVIPAAAVIAGQPGSITVQALAGTVQAQQPAVVHGPAGMITIAGVTGSVTAVTGSPGRVIRPRELMPPRAPRNHGQAGTAGAALPGPAGHTVVRALPGTVQAVTGTPGRTVRSRTASPPPRGTGHGQRGTAGAVIAGQPGQVTAAGFPGAVSITVSGTAGTVAVSGPPGFVVLTPYRYIRWHFRPGFSATEPRSHITAGNPGTIAVRALPGMASVSQ